MSSHKVICADDGMVILDIATVSTPSSFVNLIKNIQKTLETFNPK
ncbi:MAG: hypothetical protein WKF36_02695 [Candidatus Nitrosocosmicus sp.]